jgi:glycosyltransferase involved in cell wall biosynthesis
MISACIVGRNNEPYIENCFASVKDIVDEIIYLDTGSTDKTLKIAKKYADKIIEIEKTEYNWGEWRNLLIKNATQDWILSIDSDEIATDNLKQQLRGFLNSLPERIGHIRFKRAELVHDFNHYLSTPTTDAYMSHPWIYKRIGAKWVGKLHEMFEGTQEGANWDIFGVVHYNLLLTERLRLKTHPMYHDKSKYDDEFILKQWVRDSIIKELPHDVTWEEKIKYGTDFS